MIIKNVSAGTLIISDLAGSESGSNMTLPAGATVTISNQAAEDSIQLASFLTSGLIQNLGVDEPTTGTPVGGAESMEILGVTVTGAPAAGKVLTATAPTTATWSVPAPGAQGAQGGTGSQGDQGPIGPGVPVSNVFYADGGRTDTYVEDGSVSHPFKTIQAAINAVAALNQTGTVYSVKINTGLYAENLTAQSAGIGHLVLEGVGIVNVDPPSGNAFQSTSANANLKTLYFIGMTFRKPVVITGPAGSATFTDVVWTDCDFVGAAAIVASCINNVTIRGGYSECAVTYSNVNWSWIEGTQLQGALSLTADSTLDVPSQGSACTVAVQSAFASGAPTFVVGGTATLTVAVFGGRFGTGAVTIPVGCTVLGYGAILRDNWTNNGALHLRGSFVQGTLAGTPPVLTSHASQLQNDSSTSGSSVADALNTLLGTSASAASFGNYADDAAAQAGGVPVGGLYHTGGAVRVRLV